MLLACAVAGLACTSGDSSLSVTRTDSAGVEIVVSHGADRPLDWTFTPTVRIGGADTGAASFYAISAGAVATDSAGRVFVLDRQAFRLSAFDAEGLTIWSTGREGGAPGEFKFPIGVHVNGDTVQVVDGGGPELERFRTADGSHLGAERIGRFVPRTVATPFGRLVGYTEFDRDNSRQTEMLARPTDTDTLILATAPAASAKLQQFEDCPVRLMMPPILHPDLQWLVRGDRLFVVDGAEYEIDVLRDTVRVASYRRDATRRPATLEAAAADLPNGLQITLPGRGVDCRIGAREAVAQIGFADVVPEIRDVVAEWDGTLWVRRNTRRDSLGTYDIIAADGGYIGTVSNAPAPVAFLPDGRILGIEKDELEIERVVIYEVDGRP